MFVKHQRHAERREHVKPEDQYQHSAAARLAVKQQKGKVVTIMFKDQIFRTNSSVCRLICQVCRMQCTNQIWRFGWRNLQQSSQSLPACLASSSCMYLILFWLKRKLFKVPSCSQLARFLPKFIIKICSLVVATKVTFSWKQAGSTQLANNTYLGGQLATQLAIQSRSISAQILIGCQVARKRYLARQVISKMTFSINKYLAKYQISCHFFCKMLY